MVTQLKKGPDKVGRRKKQRDFLKSKDGQQALFNKTLYNIITANGGTISVPAADLMAVPENAQIKSMYVKDLDAVVITTGIAKPKSNIIVQKRQVIG